MDIKAAYLNAKLKDDIYKLSSLKVQIEKVFEN